MEPEQKILLDVLLDDDIRQRLCYGGGFACIGETCCSTLANESERIAAKLAGQGDLNAEVLNLQHIAMTFLEIFRTHRLSVSDYVESHNLYPTNKTVGQTKALH